MVLNVKNNKLFKVRKQYELSQLEARLLSLFANNKFNTYNDIKKYVYKKDIDNSLIEKEIVILENKFCLELSHNNYGARVRNKIYIDY